MRNYVIFLVLVAAMSSCGIIIKSKKSKKSASIDMTTSQENLHQGA